MKILGICGSPRKGNTEFMLKTVLNRAKELGAQTELILLRKKRIEHCKGCDNICSETGKCIIHDDMQKINKKMLNADVIIFGTPTYFNNMPGLMKDFIDRTDPLGCNRRLKNKLVSIIVVGGYLDCAKKAGKIIKDYCSIQEMKLNGVIHAQAYKKDEITKNKKVIEKCKMLAERIMKIK